VVAQVVGWSFAEQLCHLAVAHGGGHAGNVNYLPVQVQAELRVRAGGPPLSVSIYASSGLSFHLGGTHPSSRASSPWMIQKSEFSQ
jgi:hypothetical protein